MEDSQLQYIWFTDKEAINNKYHYADTIMTNVELFNKIYSIYKENLSEINFVLLIDYDPKFIMSYNIDKINKIANLFIHISKDDNNILDNFIGIFQWSITILIETLHIQLLEIRININKDHKQLIQLLLHNGFIKSYENIAEDEDIFSYNLVKVKYMYFTDYDILNNQYFISDINNDNMVLYKDTQFFNLVIANAKKLCGNQSFPLKYNIVQLEDNNPVLYIGVIINKTHFVIDSICSKNNSNDDNKLNKDKIDIILFITKLLSNSQDAKDIFELYIELNINDPLVNLLKNKGFDISNRENNTLRLVIKLKNINNVKLLRDNKVGTKLKSIATNIEHLPSLEEWRDKHLINICYCVAQFFNYISKDRIDEGFTGLQGIKNNNKNDKSQIDDAFIRPEITWEQVNYVLSEIFPCGDMLKEGEYTIDPILPEIRQSLADFIKREISNKNFLSDIKYQIQETRKSEKKKIKETLLKINNNALQIIWNYLSNGVNTLYYSGYYGIVNDKDIQDKIKYSETLALSRRSFMKNYGFNDEIENCAFQAILYVSVALTDWLEIDYIGIDEISTAYKIIIPPDLQGKMELSDDASYQSIISNAILELELIPTQDAIKLITWIMKWFANKLKNFEDSDSLKIINRFMSFANPV